ncbi:hypothetical protein GCM10011452_37070 [Gemmobacter lanyuensis]|uniref:Transposase n=1 Tax=Gemmobacter lanyuensis TaxID=1054497 RepID=A0A918MPX9_9RHOB|nr:hypothetical protein GCM10011452_37070 [Gemmobacter lanyuensis]
MRALPTSVRAGASACRHHKYSGMTVSEAKQLKALEDENAKLKKLLAEQMLDMAAMKELLSKCMVRPAVARFSCVAVWVA